jgi:hypothetical protein
MRRILFMFLFGIMLACFGVPQARAQGYTLVQGNSHPNADLTNSVSFANPNTAGNLIVVSVGWVNGGTATVSDSNHNSYVSAVGPTSNGYTSQIWYAANIAGGTNTVTVNFSLWNNSVVAVFEYAGIATASPLDVTGSAVGSSTSPSVGPVTTTQANELIFSSGYAFATLTSDPNYTMELQNTQGGYYLGLQDRPGATAGSYSASFSDSANYNWVAQIAAFKTTATTAGAPTCGISNDNGSYAPSDTEWATPPVLSIPVAKGGHYADPKFGCTVTRITDVSSEDWQQSCNNGAGCYLPIQHSYSTVSPFNANDTYLMLVDGWGWHFVTDLQGNIKVLGADMPGWTSTNGMPNNSNGYLLWDKTNPNVFYYTYQDTTANPPDGVLAKGTISGSSVSTTTLATFSQYPTVTLMADADLSQDGAHVVIVGGSQEVDGVGTTCGWDPALQQTVTSGCSGEAVFVYNIATGTIQATPGTYTTSCKGPAGRDDLCIHRVLFTPDNNVIINFVNDGTGLENGYRLWAGTTRDNALCGQALCHLQDATDHLDAGYDLSGNAVFIEEGGPSIVSGESNPCPSGSGLDARQIYSFTNGVPSSAVCLLDNQPSYHVSYRGSSSQPWAALSFYDQSVRPFPSPEYFNNPYAPSTCNGSDGKQDNPCFVHPSQQWALYQDEIMAVKIDGSTFYRLARAYSRSVALGDSNGDSYDAIPKASMSRDGKYITFDSNMAYVNGCPANFQSNTYCSDVYIVKVQ